MQSAAAAAAGGGGGAVATQHFLDPNDPDLLAHREHLHEVISELWERETDKMKALQQQSSTTGSSGSGSGAASGTGSGGGGSGSASGGSSGGSGDFKTTVDLPLARIKRIMKSDEDVRMISAEAPVLFAKACELFILELTLRSWCYSEKNKRRTLQKDDIRAAIENTDVLDFLVDVIT